MTFRHAFEGALLEILRTRDLVAVAVVSVLFYAFYYPAPYAHQVVERLPIAVVDADRSPLSRAIIRNLEAAHEVEIAAYAPDMLAAISTSCAASRLRIIARDSGLRSASTTAIGNRSTT